MSEEIEKLKEQTKNIARTIQESKRLYSHLLPVIYKYENRVIFSTLLTVLISVVESMDMATDLQFISGDDSSNQELRNFVQCLLKLKNHADRGDL